MSLYKNLIYLLFWFFLFSTAFGTNVFTSENTSYWDWYMDDCSTAESNHISITPSEIPTIWNANTIYNFSDGVYSLTWTINTNGSCIALIWSSNTILSTTNQIISVNNPYIIIKNMTLDGINKSNYGLIINSNNITAKDLIIKNTTRWIYINNANYVYLNNNIIHNNIQWINIIWWTYNNISNNKIYNQTNFWLLLSNNSNRNIFHNILLFNNAHWISQQASSYNTYNNISVFNNGGLWIRITNTTTNNNVFNNSVFYNNWTNWIEVTATASSTIFNNIKSFNNWTNFVINIATNSYWLLQNISALGLVTLWSNSDSVLGTIWWNNWTNNTTLITDSTRILNPHDWTNYLVDTSTATDTRRWIKTFWDNFVASSSSWWANVPNQIQPVQRNTAGTQLENSSLSFSASKKIGEILIVSSSPSWWWMPSQPICGNKLVETNEQCDDGNKRNGDWCSFTCTTEQPWICGNGTLEYMEECDDGNLNNGDACNSSCKIEWANLILSPKLLLQQKALEKTLGIPAALIDLKEIKTTSDFILSTINQNQKQQIEQCQYNDTNYETISFGDSTSIYQQQIDTLLNYCIVQGKQIWNQRSFGTKDYTTYAEFIKVLVKTHFLWSSIDFHNNTFDIQKVYADVSKDNWYAPYVIKAYVHDLLIPIEKIANNKIVLSPEANITKLDAVRLLIHSLKLANKDPKNIETITDTFQNANTPLTREEMAALIVYWYQLDYDVSLKIRSNNGMLMKLLAEHIKKHTQAEQIVILKNIATKIEKINESVLKKLKIHKKQFLADIAILIDFSEVFLE